MRIVKQSHLAYPQFVESGQRDARLLAGIRACRSAIVSFAAMVTAMCLWTSIALAQTYSVLYTFAGGTDGANPSGVIHDSAGNLYGTTYNGGTSKAGTVFMINPTGIKSVLYDFTGGADGGGPGAVIRDKAGNLYGTTSFGGTTAGGCAPSGCGVVFKLDASGKQTVLHTFQGPPLDGWGPQGLTRDYAGNLYGTTYLGGNGPCILFTSLIGCGAVYKVDTAGTETVLYDFTGGSNGAILGQGRLARDSGGNLYGTTYGVCSPTGCPPGLVYKVDTAGNETVLHNFCSQSGCSDGANPFAGVVRDSAGNLYGTTSRGGINPTTCPGAPLLSPGCGVVFKLDSAGAESVLYSFTGGSDGSFPQAGVVRDSAGSLYGTAAFGGATTGVCSSTTPPGCGVVFKLDPTGKQTVLYKFTGGADGWWPVTSVIRDASGNLYGTTAAGGVTTGVCSGGIPTGCGVIFKIAP